MNFFDNLYFLNDFFDNFYFFFNFDYLNGSGWVIDLSLNFFLMFF